MFLQSNSGIPVRVSAQFVPLTSQLKQTLNLLAGEEIYKISSRSHGQISWTPDVKKVTAPAKPRGLVHLRKNDVTRPIRPSSYIHYVGDECYDDQMYSHWFGGFVDYDGLLDDDFGAETVKHESHKPVCKWNPCYIQRGHLYLAKLMPFEERTYCSHGRNDKYKDRSLRACGSSVTRAVNATW